MALFHLNTDSLHHIKDTTLVQEGIREADDLQRILRNQITLLPRRWPRNALHSETVSGTKRIDPARDCSMERRLSGH